MQLYTEVELVVCSSGVTLEHEFITVNGWSYINGAVMMGWAFLNLSCDGEHRFCVTGRTGERLTVTFRV